MLGARVSRVAPSRAAAPPTPRSTLAALGARVAVVGGPATTRRAPSCAHARGRGHRRARAARAIRAPTVVKTRDRRGRVAHRAPASRARRPRATRSRWRRGSRAPRRKHSRDRIARRARDRALRLRLRRGDAGAGAGARACVAWRAAPSSAWMRATGSPSYRGVDAGDAERGRGRGRRAGWTIAGERDLRAPPRVPAQRMRVATPAS